MEVRALGKFKIDRNYTVRGVGEPGVHLLHEFYAVAILYGAVVPISVAEGD